MGARHTGSVEVVGSSPICSIIDGVLAQLGERQVRNLEVRGSIPLCSITKTRKNRNLLEDYKESTEFAKTDIHPYKYKRSIFDDIKREGNDL